MVAGFFRELSHFRGALAPTTDPFDRPAEPRCSSFRNSGRHSREYCWSRCDDHPPIRGIRRSRLHHDSLAPVRQSFGCLAFARSRADPCIHSKYWPQSSDTPVSNAFHIEQTTSILTHLRNICECERSIAPLDLADSVSLADPIAAGWCDGVAKLQLLCELGEFPSRVGADIIEHHQTTTSFVEC